MCNSGRITDEEMQCPTGLEIAFVGTVLIEKLTLH